MVDFLREWQRKLVLWGGPGVLRAYVDWMSHLKKGSPDAKTIFLMDGFFRALRADIGQKSGTLPKGMFSHLVLRRADLLLAEARRNPSVTLDKLAELEREADAAAGRPTP